LARRCLRKGTAHTRISLGCLLALRARTIVERHASAHPGLLDAPAFGGHHRAAPRSRRPLSVRRATLARLRKGMRIDVLTFEGCPNAESTRELVRQAVQIGGRGRDDRIHRGEHTGSRAADAVSRLAVGSRGRRRRRTLGELERRVRADVVRTDLAPNSLGSLLLR